MRDDLLRKLVELYTPHTPAEHAFVNQHIVQKTDYVPGHPEMNDVYNARKQATYVRSVGNGTERNHKVPGESFAPAGKTVNTRYNNDHGYMPGEDAAVAFPKPHGNLNEEMIKIGKQKNWHVAYLGELGAKYISVHPSWKEANKIANDLNWKDHYDRENGEVVPNGHHGVIDDSQAKRIFGVNEATRTRYTNASTKDLQLLSKRKTTDQEAQKAEVKNRLGKQTWRRPKKKKLEEGILDAKVRWGSHEGKDGKSKFVRWGKGYHTWGKHGYEYRKGGSDRSSTTGDLHKLLGQKEQPQPHHNPFAHLYGHRALAAEAFTLRPAAKKISYSAGVDKDVAHLTTSGPKTYRMQKTYKPGSMSMPKTPDDDNSAQHKRNIDPRYIKEIASPDFFKKLNPIFVKHKIEPEVYDGMRGAGMLWAHHANDKEERFHTVTWDNKGYHLNQMDHGNKFDGKSRPQYSSKNEDDFVQNVDHIIGNYKQQHKIK